MDFAERLNLLHALCIAQTYRAETYRNVTPEDLDFKALKSVDSAYYLACFITFRAIQAANRQPSEEVIEHFDNLSVYQAYALLIFAYLNLPVMQERQQAENNDLNNLAPDLTAAQVTIAKTLFEGLADAQLIEIMESGFNKFQLIGDAQAEHWAEFRENLDKLTVSFIIAGTDDDSPHSTDEIIPFFGQLLSQLCEAFERDLG